MLLIPQGISAPGVLFQPQVMFHRQERWKTTSPRQQFPSFQLTGQLQLSDVPVGQQQEAGFNAEVGSASDLFTKGWSWGLFPGRDGEVRGLPQGATSGCFFSLV